MFRNYVLVVVVAATCVVAACQKEEPKVSVVGFWQGTYDGSSAYFMLFRADGTVRVYDGSDTATALKGEGTYSVTDSVRTNYKYSTFSEFSTAAGLNASATSMEGTYGTESNTAGIGTFELTRQ